MFFYFWIRFPDLFFVFFLILSGIHFGISDRESKSAVQKKLEVLLRAVIIIFFPVKFHIEEIREIFFFFFVSDNLISSLFYWSDFFLHFSFFILSIFFVKFLLKKISINLLHKYLAKKLGHLKKPDEVVIVKKFPTTSTGKVIKRFLK